MTGPIAKNGWEKYQELVLYKLEQLAVAVKELQKQVGLRHTPPCDEILQVGQEVGKIKTGLRYLWLVVVGFVIGMAAFILQFMVHGG